MQYWGDRVTPFLPTYSRARNSVQHRNQILWHCIPTIAIVAGVELWRAQSGW